MTHIDVAKIRWFLLTIASRYEGPLQPMREPVLGHILHCKRCRLLIDATASILGQHVRPELYPDLDCPKDTLYGQSGGQAALGHSVPDDGSERSREEDSMLPLFKLGNVGLPVDSQATRYAREGLSPHLKGCLWCSLALHDYLATGERPALDGRYEAAKSECLRVMRAAPRPKDPQLQPSGGP